MSSSKPKLSKLFLFNPNWGPREGEEEKKIIYFWPPETEINDQVKTVGLVEAVVRFGKTFSGHPAHSLHTQKTRTVWRAVESEFFLCFTVSVPCVRRPGNCSAVASSDTSVRFSLSAAQRVKCGHQQS